jgi:hypothetical protein
MYNNNIIPSHLTNSISKISMCSNNKVLYHKISILVTRTMLDKINMDKHLH